MSPQGGPPMMVLAFTMMERGTVVGHFLNSLGAHAGSLAQWDIEPYLPGVMKFLGLLWKMCLKLVVPSSF